MALRPEIADAIAAQNARLPSSPRRDEALIRLRHGAGAVVTGQQVGLFLGPLFTLYKAASAVRVARELDAVPVFWLQTEDHDLPEIAGCDLPGARVAVEASAEDRISIAHRALPDDIGERVAELAAIVAGHVHGEAHVARLARHYRPGVRWGEAFAGLLAELFADEGLVFVDPRDPALAGAARPVHELALRRAGPIAEALVARGGPVHVREGAPLSFFHPSGAQGPRYRLAPAGEGRFSEVGGAGEHALAELLAVLEAEPLRFSTSALLRPILQDRLLPTVAYVGGPAEVAYFAQLPPLYQAFEMAMPRVVERAHFRLVDDKTRRLLDRLGLSVADAARPEEELLARCRSVPAPAEELARRVLEAFDGAGLPPSRELERARRGVANSVGKLAARLRRAELRSDADLVAAVRRLQAFLQPGGIPQERCYGLPYFAARHGDRALVERVIAAVEPFDPTTRDLYL
jgi:bacillithiol biosynthesis cysteine-adding enzyme BshC